MIHNDVEVIGMEKCCICGEEKKENLIVLGKHICADCEWVILTTRAHTNGYNRCVAKLQKLFPAEG